MSDPSEEVKLTAKDRSWLSHLAGREGLYNPYTAPKASMRWRNRFSRFVSKGLAERQERNAYDALRGGLYIITDAGRASIKPKGEQDG